MKFKTRVSQALSMVILAAMLLQTASCGTLLYPERRNSNPHNRLDPAGRRIDPAVAVLDAACLIIFIVPGVIAFAVDFATGAIYLPNGRKNTRVSDDYAVYINPENLAPETIRQVIFEYKGVDVRFDDARMKAYPAEHL